MTKKQKANREPWEVTKAEYDDPKSRFASRDLHFILTPERHGKTAEEIADAIERDGFTRGMSFPLPSSPGVMGRLPDPGTIGFIIDSKHAPSKGRGPEIKPGTKPLLRIKIEAGDTVHKAMVRAALDAGKHVPDEVLADYPDLKAKGD